MGKFFFGGQWRGRGRVGWRGMNGVTERKEGRRRRRRRREESLQKKKHKKTEEKGIILHAILQSLLLLASTHHLAHHHLSHVREVLHNIIMAKNICRFVKGSVRSLLYDIDFFK